MARRLIPSLLPVLAAALLAGCGSSSSSSGSSAATSSIPSTSQSATSSTATTPTSSTPSTPTSSTPTTPTSSTATSTTPAPKAGASAVAACKHGVQSLPHLKQSTRERLETICGKADSADVDAKRKAAREACREIVNASPLPSGEARERALAACKNAGGAKGTAK